MTVSIQFWRTIALGLALALIWALANLCIHTGYPSTWNRIQAGMKISQVRAICGPATYAGGMHPESWEASSVCGKWVLAVGHSEDTQGTDALVSTVDVYFKIAMVDKIVMHHAIDPPVADYRSFYRAFGLEWKQTGTEGKSRLP